MWLAVAVVSQAAMPWRYANLRGTRVLARCDADGAFLDDGGRVEVRYKPGASKAYRAAIRNLQATSDPVLPDDTCAAADPGEADGGAGKKPKRTSKRKASANGHDPATIPDNAIVAYTDGACSGNPGPAGLGVVLLDGERRRETCRYLGKATNNIAELTAIGVAADAIGETDRPVRIYTDSTYSIGVLTKGWKAKVNQELIAGIKRALSGLSDLELIYVKGHAGIPLNERADELAVAAVQSRASSDWIDVK